MVQKLLVESGGLLLQLPVPEPRCGHRDQRHRHPDPAAGPGRSCHPEPCLSTPGHWNSPQMVTATRQKQPKRPCPVEAQCSEKKSVPLRSGRESDSEVGLATQKHVYQSAQAVITKHHRLGSSNNRHLFLTVPEAGKFKVKVLADSVLGENSVLGLPTAAFLLRSLVAERELEQGINPVMRTPPL